MIDVCRTFNYKGTGFVEFGFAHCCIGLGSNHQPNFESDVIALKALFALSSGNDLTSA